MCQTLEQSRTKLVKLRGSTPNFELLQKIDGALLKIDGIFLDIEGAAPKANGKWTLDAKDAKELRKKWEDAIHEAQLVDQQNAKQRWCLGIVWFCLFTLLFLISIGVYIYLHWRFPPTDSDIFLWSEGALSYAEVAFWAFFGLLTWLLYSLQHFNRIGGDARLWVQWYWSKLFQGVLIAIVIVVAFKQIDFGTAITNAIIPVILGFVLGYYSDRARDYLDLIRDRLLSGTKVPKITIEPLESKLVSPVYIHGNVEGPIGTEGTLAVDKETPLAINIDDNGDFGIMVEVSAGRHLIRVEAKSPAKRTGAATIPIDMPDVKAQT
jgi:hypothetical protein